MMGSPFPLAAFIAAYLLVVLKIGPEFMKNRKPFSLKYVIAAYNIFQISASSAIVIGVHF